ncbi:MAG: hypothetical protein ACQESP_01210 [Candidatus Muiribacteriota bacterium]
MFKLLMILVVVFTLVFSYKSFLTAPENNYKPKIKAHSEELGDKINKSSNKEEEKKQVEVQTYVQTSPEEYINVQIRKSFNYFDTGNYNNQEEKSRKKLQKALETLKVIVEDDRYKNDAKSRYFIGKVYMIMNNNEYAEKRLKEASELKKNRDDFYWNNEWGKHARILLKRMQ